MTPLLQQTIQLLQLSTLELQEVTQKELALGDVAEREPVALAFHAYRDQPDVGPCVEPAVQDLQFGLDRRDEKEGEHGGQRVPGRSS